MSSTPVRADAYRRRRIHYVDERIQKRLLVALVVMELALAAAAVGALNWRLTGIVEENLYRVHLSGAEPLFDQLMLEAQKVLGVFISVNVVALLLADSIWRKFVNGVVNEFMALIGKTGELDFSADPQTADSHEVISRTIRWRARERIRLAAIREIRDRLDGEVSARGDPQGLRGMLDKLDRLLP